jgi:hypothetical protein
MEAAIHLFSIGSIVAVVLYVLLGLFSRTREPTQVFYFFVSLAFLLAGAYRISNALALHAKGLVQVSSGHTSQLMSVAAYPTATAASFWVNTLFAGGVSVCGLLGAIVFALPDREKVKTNEEPDQSEEGEKSDRSEEDTEG